MENIDSYLTALSDTVTARCPVFQPPVFTMEYTPNSVDDLFEDEQSSSKTWLQSNIGDFSNVIFSTTVNYAARVIEVTNIRTGTETDGLLADTGKVMAMLLEGNEDELTVAIGRFLEMNGYDGNLTDGRNIFYEVYHAIYAIRVLIR